MSDSLKTMISQLLLALIVVFGFVGLSDYVPLLEHAHASVEGIGDAVIKIIEFVMFFVAFKKPAENVIAGSILRDAIKSNANIASVGSASLFDKARKAA